MSKKVDIVMFPEEFNELRKQLRLNHQDILEKTLTARDIEDALGIVGAAVGVALDGSYELADLCAMLLRRLENRQRLSQGLPALAEHKGMQMIQTTIEGTAELNEAGKQKLIEQQLEQSMPEPKKLDS